MFDDNFDRVKSLEGDELIIRGVYQGYSNTYGKPVIYILSFYDVDNCNSYSSAFVNNLYAEIWGD